MKNLILVLFLGGGSFMLQAQGIPTGGIQGIPSPADPSKPVAGMTGTTASRGNARIKGSVADSTSGQPVQFATVTLLSKEDNKPVDGVLTDEKGEFVLGKIGVGEYRVSITFIGYQARIISSVKVENKGEVNLGRVTMRPDITQLQEITITGEQSLVEDKVDRIVYNAEKDITNAGGNASDVLKKVPMLTVDTDGNVQLRGSSSVRILINGKPSTIMSANVADALRQIPADIIKNVEVITSPSAKYDAEGTAGIINIITKKNNLQGVSGSVYTSVGNRTDNGGVNLNFRRKKFGINASGGGNYFNNPGDAVTERSNLFDNQVISQLSQSSKFRNEGGGGYGQIGFDYDLNDKNSINSSLRINQFRFSTINRLTSSLTGTDGTPIQFYDRSINNKNRWNNLDWNMGYTRTFKQTGRELSFLGQLGVNRPQNNSFINQTGIGEQPGPREQNLNQSQNAETTLQTDYVHPFKNKNTLEAGGKAILRRVSSDFQFSAFDSELNDFIADPRRTNAFSYDQDVVSGYATYSFNWRKLGFKVGSRYEQTYIKADFQSTETAFSQQYANLIPSATLSRDLTKTQKMRFSYTQRIQRPQIFYLNPFVNYSDTLNLFSGNPNLAPELSHSFDLGYSAFAKSNSINVSLYWRQTDNAIESVRSVDELGVSRTTFLNIASNRTVGLGLFGSAQPTTKWRISGNVNLYYTMLNSPALEASNRSWMYTFNMNTSYTFPRGFSAQFFGFFNSPRVQLQGRSSGFYNYNLAVKKELFRKKGNLSLGLDNPFSRTVRMDSFFQSQTFVSHDVRNMYRRGVRVSYNHQFGKMDFNAKPRRKKSISNDDAKGGDSGANGQ